MEKSIIGLTLAAAIAVWAFLSLVGTHDSNRSKTEAQIERDRAEFDRDFARLTGTPKAQQEQLAKRADEAGKRADDIRTEADRMTKIEAEKRKVLEEAVEADIKSQGGPDLTAVSEQIAKQLDKGVSK